MPEARIDAQLRRAVEDASRGCCEYCRSPERFAVQAFDLDHIVPKSKGGGSTLGNLALSCSGCNGHKYNRTEALDPLSGEAAPLYHPRRETWGDHFSWTADYARIVGVTPTGGRPSQRCT
jgi:5-methylcytosine-specific restriction endonuclease McrA